MAQLLRQRPGQLLHGRHHVGQPPAGADPPCGNGTQHRGQGAPAETVAAAPHHGRILEQIQAQTAQVASRWRYLTAFPAAMVVYRARWGKHAPEGARPGNAWKWRRGGTAVSGSGTCLAKATPGGSDIHTAPVMEQHPGPAPAGIYGQKGTRAAAFCPWGGRGICKASSYPSGCPGEGGVRPGGGSRRQGSQQECGE